MKARVQTNEMGDGQKEENGTRRSTRAAKADNDYRVHTGVTRRRGMKKSSEKREDGKKKRHDRVAREDGRPQESGAPASARMERSQGEKKIEWREAE